MIVASIVTYHTDLDELATVLHCLCRCPMVKRVDVVDNGSEERIAEFCKIYGRRVCYIPAPNRGYGAGHNLSIRRSMKENDTDYHLVINSDVYFAPGVIESLITVMENDSGVGQIIPRVIYPDGRPQCAYHPIPSPMDLISHRFVPKRFNRRRMQRYEIDATQYTRPVNIPYHHGCFMLFRMSALKEVGIFDERFFMYPEDIDMSRRVHAAYKTFVVPSLTVTHIHHAASRANLRMLWIHASNMIKYFIKWGFVFDRSRREFNRRLIAELEAARK